MEPYNKFKYPEILDTQKTILPQQKNHALDEDMDLTTNFSK